LTTTTRITLHQRELDGHLLERLGQPGDLGLGQLQLVVALPAPHARLGRGQRRQRTLLGDRADPHDRRSVDVLGGRRLGDRHLLADQLQPDLVLLRRRQQPLVAPADMVGSAMLFGHDQILRDHSENPSDVG